MRLDGETLEDFWAEFTIDELRNIKAAARSTQERTLMEGLGGDPRLDHLMASVAGEMERRERRRRSVQ